MKENIMRDKIISFVLWLLIWGAVVYGYSYYISSKSQVWFPNNWQTRGNFDTSTMSDDQLQKMADRAWITLAELKKKLDAGENIRNLMPARTWSWARPSWDSQWTKISDVTSSTWSN